jgi:hypothetical protein
MFPARRSYMSHLVRLPGCSHGTDSTKRASPLILSGGAYLFTGLLDNPERSRGEKSN